MFKKGVYPDNVSLTIPKIDSIPPENSGYVRADGDHKRILRFHQSATAHWLWDNQTLSNPHRECSVCSTDPFQCDLLCRPRYTVVSYASAHTTCSQTFPSKWEGLPFSRSEHERGEHGLQRGIAHDSLVFIRQTLINSNCKLDRPPCRSNCPTSRAKNCVHRKPINF